MAGVPYIFEPGSIAAASQVNANFEHVMDLIGHDSTKDEWRLQGSIAFGPQNINYLTAQTAAGGYLTFNAKQDNQGRFVRVVGGRTGSAVGVGPNGISMRATSKTTGDINPQLTEVMGIREKFIRIPTSVGIVTTSTDNPSNGHYRLTYVPLNHPITLYENVSLGKGVREHNLYDRGVPKEAKAIQVMLYATATTWSGAALILMERRQERHRKYGVAVHSYGGNAAMYGRSTVQGMVHVGSGPYAGRIVEERTADFSEASCWIQGYWC